MSGHFKIIPWVYIDDLIKHKEIDPPELIQKWVKSMSDFQEWFHEGNAYGNLLNEYLEIK